MQKHFSGKTHFLNFLFLRARIIEKSHKTPLSQFCFNPLNFVSLFSSRENETKLSGDSNNYIYNFFLLETNFNCAYWTKLLAQLAERETVEAEQFSLDH